MSKFRQFIPFSLMSAVAAVLALIIAWEPEPAVAERPVTESPVLKSSIIELGGTQAPFCPDAVWPNITRDCLLFADEKTADRTVRAIALGSDR